MASFTVKDIPDDLLARIKAAAKREQRSMNGQIIWDLKQAHPADQGTGTTETER